MEDNIRVIKYTYEELLKKREELTSFDDPKNYLKNFLGSYTSFLLKNPNISNNEIALSIAVFNKRIIGRLGFIKGTYQINKENFPVLWLTGFFLDNKYYQTGSGAMLLLNGINTKLPLLASGGPSKECQNLYRATGFFELGPLKRYLFFFNLNFPITYLIKNKRIGYAISQIFQKPFLLITNTALKLLNRQTNITFKSVKTFDKRIDEIETLAKNNIFPTDASLLNWSIGAPGTKNYLFELYMKKSFIGYIILRVLPFKDVRLGSQACKIGSLHHYRIIKKAKSVAFKKEIIVFSLKFLSKKNIDIFECQSLDDQMASACKRLFMLKKGGNKIFFRSKKHSKIVQSLKLNLSKSISDVILY